MEGSSYLQSVRSLLWAFKIDFQLFPITKIFNTDIKEETLEYNLALGPLEYNGSVTKLLF